MAQLTAITGLDRASIYRAAALAGLGCPGHFDYPFGQIRYLPAGLAALVTSLDENGEPVAAAALREALRQQRQRAATAQGATRPSGWLATHEARAEEAAA
jgi:hypothetical protein